MHGDECPQWYAPGTLYYWSAYRTLKQKAAQAFITLTPQAIALLDATAQQMCADGTLTRAALVRQVWDRKSDWEPASPFEPPF